VWGERFEIVGYCVRRKVWIGRVLCVGRELWSCRV